MTTPHPNTSRGGPARTARQTCTLSEAAELLGISRAAAYRAAGKGEIPTVRLGSRLLVPLPLLHRMLGLGSSDPDEATNPLTQRPNALGSGPSSITTKDAPRAVGAASEGNDHTTPTKPFMEGQRS